MAVERNSSGSPHWGLKNKDNSDDQSESEKENSKYEDTTVNNITNPPSEPEMSRRRDSFSFHDDLPAEHKKIQERKRSIADEFQHRQSISHSLSVDDAIPECAVEMPALATPQVEAKRDSHQFGYMEAGIEAQDTDTNPHKYSGNKETGQPLPGGTKTENVVAVEKAREGVLLTKAEVEKLKDAISPMNLDGSPASNKSSPAFAAKPSPPPFAISTPPSAANMARGASYKSTSPTIAAVARPTADKIANPPGSSANAAPSRLASTSARPSTSSAASSAAGATAKKSAPSASSGSGFVRPRPKSPMRPTRLLSSLTAPTASSTQKMAGAPANDVTTQRRRGSTTGGVPSVKASGDREPSRVARGDSLRRANSHTRPSVGPPPAKDVVKKPVSKVIPSSSTSSVNTKPTNDSFLERMMRPTAASQSKTHVKAEEQKDKVAKPKPVVSAASAPVQIKHAEREKPQARAQPTIELAGDPSSPTGNTFKKLPRGVVPIPKLAKRKSKPEPLKDSTIQEIKIEHRRASSGPRSPRPAIVSNPTTIAEEEEPEETVGVDDDGNLGHVSLSEDSDPAAKDGQPRSISEQAEAVPAGAHVDGSNDEAAGVKSNAPSPTSQPMADNVSAGLVDVSEKSGGSALDNGSNYVIKKPATQESLDIAAEAVDDANMQKDVADEGSKKADVKKADAAQHFAQMYQSNSSMLSGSALDTDDEETPEVEKKDPLAEKMGDDILRAEADATTDLARGEVDFKKDNVEDVEATTLAS